MRISSQVAPRPSRAWATRASMAASSLMLACAPAGGRSSGSDLDQAGVVGGRARRRRAVLREHVGAATHVLPGGVGGEPGAFLDGYHATGDALGDVGGKDGGAAVVEDAHALAVHDATGVGVGGMDPYVLP